MISILQICLYQLLILSPLTSAQLSEPCYGNVYCNCFQFSVNYKTYFCKKPSTRGMVTLDVRHSDGITHAEIESFATFNHPDYHKLFIKLDEWRPFPVNLTILYSALPNVPFIEVLENFDPRNTITHLTFTKAEPLPHSNAPPALQPNHFTLLRALVILNLSENKLEDLPEELFADLDRLETLLLNKNNIQRLPTKLFEPLKNLKILNLSENQLTVLSGKIFQNLLSLQVLNLNENKLKTLPTLIFSPLTQLKDLKLANNNLTVLKTGVFRKLKNLIMLNLSGNKLNNLMKSVFSPLTELKYLELANNNMTVLKDGIFDNLKNLKTVNLDGNQLKPKSWLTQLGSRLQKAFKMVPEKKKTEDFVLSDPGALSTLRPCF
ncbi:carboxypeptidase N subunit 2-like [Planococcus citri]|uniref:carboxypeptidase N subunit 2-like n=1 Tax=Planococcus citri TaxID=170843 RepID=UPI0031F7E564